ncbi:MAG: hydroxymethylbilane synthase [Succinivibrionaceae bacterium]
MNLNKTVFKIGTRGSELALRQTNMVIDVLQHSYPNLSFEIIKFKTKGDRIQNVPLQNFGGKGVFVEDLTKSLENSEIDLAVHSAKDLPNDIGKSTMQIVLPRGDVRDVLLQLKENKGTLKIIGTSSLRRCFYFKEYECRTLRGNVPTRLEKLRENLFDGIILAAAGLERLNLLAEKDIEYTFLSPEKYIPAPCQGIIAIQTLPNSKVWQKIKCIENFYSKFEFIFERKILSILQANCHEVVGVYSKLINKKTFKAFLMIERNNILYQGEILEEKNDEYKISDIEYLALKLIQISKLQIKEI